MSGIAPTIAPNADSYNFVLCKDKWNPEMKQVIPTYDETLHSYNITHGDGVARTTLFVNSQHAFNALRKRGWVDFTASYRQSVEVAEEVVEKPKTRRGRGRKR